MRGGAPGFITTGHDPGCAHLDYSACNCSKATVAPASARPTQLETSPAAVGCEIIIFPATVELDEVVAYWRNVGPGKGFVTLTCWGNAWTAYFGGMGDQTIQPFFYDASTSYLVHKLGVTPHLKQTKRDHAYLSRVIEAAKVR